MSALSPTIVLIHGGFHQPANYEMFTSKFKALGLEVHAPRLPTMNGARPPNADLYTDADFINAYVKRLIQAGRNVVAIMHSYGGQVGTGALAGLSKAERAKKSLAGGIVHLVYMCGFALPEGRAMIDKVNEFGHGALMPLAFDFADDDTCVHRDPANILVGPGLSEAETAHYVSLLGRWNGKGMYQKIKKAAWREVPVTYILTSQDMALPPDYQKSMLEKMKADGKPAEIVEVKTGHSPQATATDEVVDVISKVVAKTAA